MRASPLEALAASILFGLSVVLATVLTKQMHPLHLITLSYAIAGLALLPLTLFRAKRAAKAPAFQGLRSVRRDLLVTFVARWLLAGVLISYGWSLTAGAHATLLVLLEFVFVLLWGHALHIERLQARRLGLAALVLAGGALFILSAGPIGSLAIGDALITAGFALTAYTFYPIQRITRAMPAASYIALSLLLTALAFSPTLALFPFTPPDPFLLLAYVATMGLGFTLWASSLRTVPPWLVSTLLTLQPVAGGLLAWLWLREALLPLQFAGAALMLAAVWLLGRTRQRKA